MRCFCGYGYQCLQHPQMRFSPITPSLKDLPVPHPGALFLQREKEPQFLFKYKETFFVLNCVCA